jgi:hypothetical protein
MVGIEIEGEIKMQNDPIRNFYIKGYVDQQAGKRNSRSVPQNYKLAYVSGRHDSASGKPNRYEVSK